jgi:hypothetical protein
MDWMWAFLKATLIPGLIVRIGVQYLHCHIFKPLPRHHVRKTKCYDTHRQIYHHQERADVHQSNDPMYRDHRKHDTDSKPSDYFRVFCRETQFQRELRSKPPPKPRRPTRSRQKDVWDSESHDTSSELPSISLDLPTFNALFDTLSFEYGTPWASESEGPIDIGPATMALDLPLFDELFDGLQFKFEAKIKDQWES